jgi:AcrR family transcriptional regulator
VAKVTTPRERWVEEGLRALAAGGPGAVRVEVLAKELSVTKGGFYWHFADRRALLDAMLDAWEQEGVDDPITQVDATGGDGRMRLRELFAIAVAAADRVPLELAIRDWARRDASVHARVARVDNRRMDYMRQLFSDFCDDPAEVEVRCFLVFSTFVGQGFVAASHGSRSRADVLHTALEFLLA